MRTTTALLLLALLAGAAPAQPRRTMDFEPGHLELPLTVSERSGVDRSGVVVTSGVPFPPGFLKDPGRLVILDRTGRPVPTQVSVMSRWWKPAHDDSVRWARISFPAGVEASRYAKYTLVDRAVKEGKVPGAPFPRALLEDKGDDLVVDTAAARFTVPKKGAVLIRRAEVGGVNLLGTDGVRVLLTGGDWPDMGMKTGALHLAHHPAVEVEERGPVRVVLAVHGAFRGKGPGACKGDMYDFTVRLYFHAGSARVRVVHTLRNGRVGADLHVWPVEDLSFMAHLQTGEAAGALLLGEREPVSVDLGKVRVASLYQDSSGGAQWKSLRPGTYAAWLSPYTRIPQEGNPKKFAYPVRGVSFSGFEIRADDKVLERGSRARGVLDVSGIRGGLRVSQRHFRERYPGVMTASSAAVRVGLWPGEFDGVLFLEPGQRFTRDLLLDFHAGPASRDAMDRTYRVHSHRLLFTAPAPWYVRTRAWDAGLAKAGRRGPRKGGRAGLRGLNTAALDGIDVGWDWFGWIKGWNAGGAHWNQSTCFAEWLLWEDRTAFDIAEARALWAADAAPLHFDPCDLARWWRAMQVMKDYQWKVHGLTLRTYPGFYKRAVWGNPDDGHMGMFMWFEYHYLTGDRHVRESCEALGRRSLAYLWRWLHDDTRTGGPGGRPVPWCRKRDPDDPAYRLHSRYTGWPLYNLMLHYQLTGDAALAAAGARIAAGLRNTARWSPIGFLTTKINNAGDKSVYGNQLATGPTPTDSASQCYANFQIGVVATGLVQYYRETLDEEALDALVGIADFFTHHALIRDRGGRMFGWPYVFCDYWGPYTLGDFDRRRRPNWLNQNFRVVQPLGWIYLNTGRPDYLEVLRAALARMRGTDLRVPAAILAVTTRREDRTPPAAVADLEAEAAAGGAVRLTWTAPGDDGDWGTAARYQVKRSRSPMVERVAGWPDRTEPLPQNAAEWEDRARAFHVRQRAFWSTLNLKGEPKPSKAGSRESFEVKGLEAGIWYLALKTWDGGPNMSPLSNVVRVEVQ